MTTQAVTFQEMMMSPVILRVVNRIKTPLSKFQDFFGYTMGNGMASDSVKGRDAGWDIFDSTRQFAGARAPGTGPGRVRKKPIGHVSAQLMRCHESIIIFDEEVYKTRPLGGQIGSTVDIRGQNHIRRQIQFMTQRFRNTREWCFSRMLRGGFNINPTGDTFKLQEYNASPSDGSVPVNYQIPSTNMTRLDMGTGSNILTDWNVLSADILGQMHKINGAMERLHGRPLRHVWLNSTTMQNVLNNTGLAQIAGTANTVFTQYSPSQARSIEGIPDTGFEITMRGLPWLTWHVYDGVLSVDGDTDGTTTSEVTKLIPNDYAIFLPDPDDSWVGVIDGSELIRETEVSQPREVQGFAAWATPVIDPPGQELKFLDNSLPVLYVPNCVAYGYVGA